MDIDQYYEQIEAYINNSLSKADRASFEQKLKANPVLKKAVLSHILANEAIGLSIEDKVAKKLDRLAQKRAAISTPSPLKVGWKKPLSIAAGFLLFIVAGLAIWANQNYSNKALSTKLYADSTLPTVRSGEEANQTFVNALSAFSKKDYPTVLKTLNNTAPTASYFREAQYLMAHANWQEKKYQPAATLFESLLANTLPSSIDKEELAWNHLLTTLQLKGGASEAFKEKMAAILENPQHGYYTKAKDLNHKLSSPWRKLAF